jgi:hypothetical protein
MHDRPYRLGWINWRGASTAPASRQTSVPTLCGAVSPISSNVLGGGDLAPGRGFHGNCASFNLKNRSEVIHVNLDKFPHIQEILASKIRSAGATDGGGEPLRLVVPPNVPIETVGQRAYDIGPCRRYAANNRDDLPRAALDTDSAQ